ncbi:hypothetical protein L226DRAFT_571707 [Lentinus tigrinus ALCF2SS1-7]|uniref:uncharacterized protein n=1 Tax=Lentinus tigrinus ALCF2SS1-7 TaxID=1328758 RepID=UPI0011663FEB|nr:hypothetical protein L226DRAFT_571707 [Lentinus tigrinus ALCF2SS1-7]
MRAILLSCAVVGLGGVLYIYFWLRRQRWSRLRSPRFVFSATTTVRAHRTTNLELAIPRPPGFHNSVQPTIVRHFNPARVRSPVSDDNPKAELVEDASMALMAKDPEDPDQLEMVDATVARSPTPVVPEQQPRKRVKTRTLVIHPIPASQSSASELARGASPGLEAGPSRPAVASRHGGEDRHYEAPPSPLTDLSSDSDDASTDARINVHARRVASPGRMQADKARPILVLPRKEYKRPDTEDPTQLVVTHYFQTKGPMPIPEPPHFVQDQRFIGDLFYHRNTVDPDHSQLWLWIDDELGPRWKYVHIGYVREDGRRLSLTEKRRTPSWIRRGYYNRRDAEDRL